LAPAAAEEHGDLKQELAQLTKDVRGRVEPLPQVRPYEPVPYTAEGQIDPFRPERIDVRGGGSRASVSKLAPDPNRPKEPPRVVSAGIDPDARHDHQNKEVFALVKAGPNLYRVRKGNYMGQNFGVVTAIDEGAINLKELVQDSGGEWVERTSALQLVEGQTMNTKTMKAVYGFALWLAGIGLALAQSNSIESFEVSQQAGKTIVRITTKGAAAQRAAELRGRQSRAHRLRLPEYRQRARPRQPGHRPGRGCAA